MVDLFFGAVLRDVDLLEVLFFDALFFDALFFEGLFFEALFFAALFLAVFFDGTFLPSLRASERPMAMACLRLFTFFPLLPLFSWPCFFSCMAFLFKKL